MKRKIVEKIAREFGCEVEVGGKHYRILYNGKLVSVCPQGKERDRMPLTVDEMLRRSIKRGIERGGLS